MPGGAASRPGGRVTPLALPTLVLLVAVVSGPSVGLAQSPRGDRMVLVFAPAGNDPRLDTLAADRAELDCELVNRHVVVEVIIGADTSRRASLRRAYGVPVEEFVAILVGKDGGEKLRSRGSVDLAAMLRLIDTMPMRRTEMDEDRDCPGSASTAPSASGVRV
jgi:hypothetical protein